MSTTGAPPLAVHPFVRGMTAEHISRPGEVARHITVPGRYRLFEDDGTAGRFWLVEAGQVALDVQVPGCGLVIIEAPGRVEVRLVVAVSAVSVAARRGYHAAHAGVRAGWPGGAPAL